MSVATRLYRGETSYDFIGHKKRWYVASGVAVLVSIVSLLTLGLTLGIEFKGGASFQFPSGGHSVAEAQSTVANVGVGEVVATKLSSGDLRVQTPPLDDAKTRAVEDALQSRLGIPRDRLSPSNISASWGSDITSKAVQALIVFLIAVTIYISVVYEWKMAAAALVALLHDLIITAGIYSLVGFEVTPSTVIALLTILGYSLYDTVVVFDKVRENVRGIVASDRYTYSGAANIAVNQTLMRSINTSTIALLPVAALLFVGAGLLGAGTLKDLALALLIGLAVGAYSSIFLATPLLTQLKEREQPMKALAARVAHRQRRGISASEPGRSRAAERKATREATASGAPARSGGAPVELTKPSALDTLVPPVEPADSESVVVGAGAPSLGSVRRPAGATTRPGGRAKGRPGSKKRR